MKVGSRMPEIIYKFENQNIANFEVNFKKKGDITFTMYFDFETSTGTTSQNHLEDVEMDQIFYSLIFAFHLKLQLDGKVIIRSFNHSLEKVNDVSYLTDEMLQNLDSIIARQLKFNCDILKKLSSKKATRRFLEFYTY